MEDGKATGEEGANQMLRLLQRISELEAAEMEHCGAEAGTCQAAAKGHNGGYCDGTEFAMLTMRAPVTGVLGLN